MPPRGNFRWRACFSGAPFFALLLGAHVFSRLLGALFFAMLLGAPVYLRLGCFCAFLRRACLFAALLFFNFFGAPLLLFLPRPAFAKGARWSAAGFAFGFAPKRPLKSFRQKKIHKKAAPAPARKARLSKGRQKSGKRAAKERQAKAIFVRAPELVRGPLGGPSTLVRELSEGLRERAVRGRLQNGLL